MLLVRSFCFNALFYSFTVAVCLVMLWALALPRRPFLAVVRWYLSSIAVFERAILGLRYQVGGRERVPAGCRVIIAAKHQSAWETLKLHLLFDDPAIVLKRELIEVPLWGWFARRLEMIPVDRGARSRAVSAMLETARRRVAAGRPLVIFPQGTRVAPGDHRAYRIGVGVLYEELGLPVVPMALNSGVFWPRRRFVKTPGTITVAFLEPIAAGLPRDEMMATLEARLEAETDRLVAAARGDTERPHPSDATADGITAAGGGATGATPRDGDDAVIRDQIF